MHAGTCCISTPYPFAKEMLIDGAGILVPFEDSSGVARAVLFALADQQRAADIGRVAASRCTSWIEVAKLFLRIVEDIAVLQ